MANKQRGEVDIKIGGKNYKGVLTLGALAHLEGVFDVDKPGDLDRIIGFPTYDQLVTLAHGIINFRKEGEVISREEILEADLIWSDVWKPIVEAAKLSNPEPVGKAEKEEGEAA